MLSLLMVTSSNAIRFTAFITFIIATGNKTRSFVIWPGCWWKTTITTETTCMAACFKNRNGRLDKFLGRRWSFPKNKELTNEIFSGNVCIFFTIGSDANTIRHSFDGTESPATSATETDPNEIIQKSVMFEHFLMEN